MKQAKRLSFIIPAYNEEGNLDSVVAKIDSIAPRFCSDYEMIIVNDGSHDSTRKVSIKLAKQNNRVRVFHNKENKGMGYSYFKGVKKARFEYIMIVFADNDHPAMSIQKVVSRIGKADIIIPFYTNFYVSKTWLRHVVSVTYTHLLNVISDLPLRYYNGITIHKTELVRGIENLSTGFGFQAEIIVNLTKNGASFVEVGIENEERGAGVTSAFKPSNVFRVCRSLSRLFWKYKVKRNDLISYTYDDKYKHRAPWFIFFAPLVNRFRSDFYFIFEKQIKFNSSTKVLDIGVTDSQINYFHKLYPYRDKITAAGLAERNIILERTFPEITYKQVKESFPYPFRNNEFDVVHSSAVIEHVGSRENQLKFIKELFRIGKRGMISTPNRWYPIEFHTFLPLIHWLPTNVYRKIFTKLGMEIYSQEKNLNLLSYRDVEYLMKKSGVKKYSIIKKRTFGFVSNLLIFWEK